MQLISTLIAVTDLPRSKQFYHDLLGLEVVLDFGANVTLTGGVVLQAADRWQELIQKDASALHFGHHTSELYFETNDLDLFLTRLNARPDIPLVHPVVEHPWGQRVTRFYDPDQHMIEVGEALTIVVKRFLDRGLTPAETAARMDVPLDYVQQCVREETSAR